MFLHSALSYVVNVSVGILSINILLLSENVIFSLNTNDISYIMTILKPRQFFKHFDGVDVDNIERVGLHY